MNIYKILFILLFIWSSIYNISFSKECFRLKNFFPAVNTVIFQLIAVVLCIGYILK